MRSDTEYVSLLNLLPSASCRDLMIRTIEYVRTVVPFTSIDPYIMALLWMILDGSSSSLELDFSRGVCNLSNRLQLTPLPPLSAFQKLYVPFLAFDSYQVTHFLIKRNQHVGNNVMHYSLRHVNYRMDINFFILTSTTYR